ncbi:putative dna-directed rna polymerases i protein [Ilyonectria robusta]
MKPPVYLNAMFVKDWLSVTVMRARVRLNTVCLDAGISLGILPEISLSWAVMAAIGLVAQIPRLYRSTHSPASQHLVCQPSHSCSFGSRTKRNPSRVCISFSLCLALRDNVDHETFSWASAQSKLLLADLDDAPAARTPAPRKSSPRSCGRVSQSRRSQAQQFAVVQLTSHPEGIVARSEGSSSLASP